MRNKSKKIFGIMALALCFALSLSACAGKRESMRILVLSGSTGLGMVKLMEDAETGKTANTYSFEVFDAPETLLPDVMSGNFTVAALPTNVAARLYQKTGGKVQMLAVNTLGVLYLLQCGTADVKAMSDLKGKMVYATGQGATPQYALEYVLRKNGLVPGTDVEIEYFATADEVVAHASDGALLLLPEPKVTALTGQREDLSMVLDWTEEWNKVCQTPLVQGCVVVNPDFAAAHPQAVQTFLDEYEASVEYVKTHPKEASAAVAQYGIIPKAPLAEKAIPRSNLTFLTGTEMKAALEGFYGVLFDADPASVGGQLPDGGFYYGAS